MKILGKQVLRKEIAFTKALRQERAWHSYSVIGGGDTTGEMARRLERWRVLEPS